MLVSIAATELTVMVAFNLLAVGNRMPPVLVNLADTAILSLVATSLIFRWVVNPMRRFPIDALKIDISFIRNVVINPDDAAIVRTIIAMAHSLNLKVIAEGVENALD